MKNNDLGLLLTILHHNDGKIEGRKRFQKIICILKYKYNIPLSYDFIPYYYGPYSEGLANTLDLLVSLGMLKEEERTVNNDISQYVYSLMPAGNKLISSIKNIDQDSINKIRSALDKIRTMNTTDLVKLSKEILY